MDIHAPTCEEKAWGSAEIYCKREGLEVGIFTCLPGQSLELHDHPGEEEYIYVLDGQGIFVVMDSEMLVESGSVVRIPKDAKHYIRNKSNKPLMCAYVVLGD